MKQASAEVWNAELKLKHTIKRDLSGDVMFKTASGISPMIATSPTATDTITEGINFFKLRKVNNINAATVKIKLNDVTKWTITAIGFTTPANPIIKTTLVASPVIKLQAIGGKATINSAQLPLIDDKTTVMI